MTTTLTRLMKAEEFYEWANRPENAPKSYELERGEVVEVSRPGEQHGFVCGNVIYVLGGYVRQVRKGYVCGNDTGIIWERDPDTVRGPDVILSDKMVRYADLCPKYSDEPPRLVLEVMSPNDRIGKMNLRIAQFLSWGVCLVWLVDPEDRTVTVYRADRAHRVFKADQELVGDELLPDFRCQVGDLFYVPGEEPLPPASPAPASPPPASP
jgi:Uma2 family endonuclease